MPRFLVVVALGVILGPGCAGLRPNTGLRCEADGRTRWALHRAPHAVVLTDLEDPAARGVVAAVEAAHRALEATGLIALPSAPLRVLAGTYDGGEIPTWYVPDSLEEYPLGFVVLTDEGATLVVRLRSDDPRGNVARPDGLTAREQSALVHATVRALSRAAVPAIPAWLEDGLASYLEDVRVEEGRARVGLPGRDVLDRRRASVEVPLAELLSVRPCEELEHQTWRAARWQSFLLFHHLTTHRNADLRTYVTRLAAGEGALAAWRAAFPDLDPGTPDSLRGLEEALHTLGSRRQFTEATYPLAPSAREVTRTPLACTDARLARLETWSDVGLRDRLDAESRQLLAEVPGQPVALVARAELAPPPDRVPALLAALQQAPGSGRGWALLLEGLEAGAERAEAATRASALGGGDPGIEVRVAEARLAEGAAGEAAQIARSVVAAAPWSVRGTLVLARALARQGQCAEARSVLARAEGRYAEQCPDRPDRLPLWHVEPDRLYPLPAGTLEAARREVGACGATAGHPGGT